MSKTDLIPRLVVVLLPVVLGGCKSFDLKRPIPWMVGEETATGQAMHIVGTWTDTVLYQQGRRPQRGFGGRLMFYGVDETEPLKVEGTLVVYAFDERGREPDDNRPTKKFVFPADQLAKHYSTSELGHSYSFWLPWDEVGGEQKDISLITRFQPTHGSVIVGAATRHVLPGTPTGQQHEPPRGVQQAAYQSAPPGRGAVNLAGYVQENGPGSASDGRHMMVATIPVPEDWATAPPQVATSQPAPQQTMPQMPGHASPAYRPQNVNPQQAAQPPAGVPANPSGPSDGPAASGQPTAQTTGEPNPAFQPRATGFAPRQPRVPGQSISRLVRDRAGWPRFR